MVFTEEDRDRLKRIEAWLLKANLASPNEASGALSAAKSVIVQLGQELQAAGNTLTMAAERLKGCQGQGTAASHVKQAATRALQAAQGAQ